MDTVTLIRSTIRSLLGSPQSELRGLLRRDPTPQQPTCSPRSYPLPAKQPATERTVSEQVPATEKPAVEEPPPRSRPRSPPPSKPHRERNTHVVASVQENEAGRNLRSR